MNKAAELIEIMRTSDTLETAIDRALSELHYTPDELLKDAGVIIGVLSPIECNSSGTFEN